MIQQAHKTKLDDAYCDLHGRVAIRLVGATPSDRQLVTKALGLAVSPSPCGDDLVLRFVDHVGGPSERLIGSDDVAFTDHDFVVNRAKHRARVQIPFDRLGTSCELDIERGGMKVPLLLPILNITAVSRGMVPLHASAFCFQGKGAVVTGWARGGKTTSLLGFMGQGAEFVSDDWAYIDVERRRIHGLSTAVEVSDRQLTEQPAYLARVGRRHRWQMHTARLAEQTICRLEESRWGSKVVPHNVVRHLLPALRRRRSVEVSPQSLFGSNSPSSGIPAEAPLNAIFFTLSHTSPDIQVRPATPDELVERIALMLEQEYAELLATYRKFRFAFPDRRSDLLDNLQQHIREQLAQLLDNTPAFLVYHPYPVRAEAMFVALQRWL